MFLFDMQTFGRRRASVALTALPNILGGGGIKQFAVVCLLIEVNQTVNLLTNSYTI